MTFKQRLEYQINKTDREDKQLIRDIQRQDRQFKQRLQGERSVGLVEGDKQGARGRSNDLIRDEEEESKKQHSSSFVGRSSIAKRFRNVLIKEHYMAVFDDSKSNKA